MKLCTKLFTENVRVVSPDKFVNLIIENLDNQNNNEIPFLSYPNPAEDLFNIEFWEETKNILSVELFNISGSKEKINDLTIESISEKKSKIKLKISNLKSGVYFLKINLKNNNIFIDKILKK